MAKTIQLKSNVTLNDEEYKKGAVLSVCESLRDELVSDGLAEDYVEPKGKGKE